MGQIQGQVNGLIGTVAGAAAVGGKLAGKFSKTSDAGGGEDKNIAASVNGELAAKKAALARRQLQANINAIYANKELSNKAKTRRLGKLVDEYAGGKKDGTKAK